MTEFNKIESNQSYRLIGLAALMRCVMSGEDLGPLGSELIALAGSDPRCADANVLMDISLILQLRGHRELGLEMQAQALAKQQRYAPPMQRGQGDRQRAALRLLVVMGPGDLMANSPLELLLEDADVALDLVYVTATQPLPVALPEHDVLFVAIAESEQNLPLLRSLAQALEHWPRPVLNDPARIASLSRDQNYARLKSIAGVVMPATRRVCRQVLADLAADRLPVAVLPDGGDFPLIVRPVDSHAGNGLEKLESAAALTAYLAHSPSASAPEEEFYLSRFVDYRAADGAFRKYRIVLIGARPYLCHVGISSHWMVHYLNAGMAESAEKRAEEARLMAEFDVTFAQRHAVALAEIGQRIGLDYVGIDCGETPDGQLLIFEVDSCMIVHSLDSIELFPYKQPQMQKVFAAFFQLLQQAARPL